MAKKKIIIISIVILIVLITGLFYFVHPHSYALRESKTPTCTEDGYEIYRCWCGNEYRTEQKQTEHKYNSTVEEPTCTDAGKTVYTCELCGDTYEEPIEAIGHDYEESSKEPTCTESGERVLKCKHCGDTYTEPIEALGHEYKDGVCIRCGEADPSVKAEKNPTTMDTVAGKSVQQKAPASTPTQGTNDRSNDDFGDGLGDTGQSMAAETGWDYVDLSDWDSIPSQNSGLYGE